MTELFEGEPLQTRYPCFEACIEDAVGVRLAVELGADSIELTCGLTDGGLTPSAGALVTALRDARDIPVLVMIRPRGGDFVYSERELAVMLEDIVHFRRLAASLKKQIGFIFGTLTTHG